MCRTEIINNAKNFECYLISHQAFMLCMREYLGLYAFATSYHSERFREIIQGKRCCQHGLGIDHAATDEVESSLKGEEDPRIMVLSLGFITRYSHHQLQRLRLLRKKTHPKPGKELYPGVRPGCQASSLALNRPTVLPYHYFLQNTAWSARFSCIPEQWCLPLCYAAPIPQLSFSST